MPIVPPVIPTDSICQDRIFRSPADPRNQIELPNALGGGPIVPSEAIQTTEPATFRNGVDRRTFLKVVAQAAAAIGLSGTMAAQFISAVEKGARPSVIWLHFQE